MKTPMNHFYRYLIVILSLCVVLAASGIGEPIEIAAAKSKVVHTQKGKASYYGGRFHGRKTASGERFNKYAPMAAHPYWSFGTVVRVTNLKNGRSTEVRVVDRGPAKRAQRKGVIIDLSYGTARKLGFIKQGRTPVRLDVVKWGKKKKGK